ncbi:hypothetical protein ACFTQ7_22100 [Lysinibacillus sp. NPDC056959]|uniref:hypothetical protein n=1 Tax=Lysinibacillus sp. NPDC056959 TaxID=3345981 RepID=UPI003626DDEC
MPTFLAFPKKAAILLQRKIAAFTYTVCIDLRIFPCFAWVFGHLPRVFAFLPRVFASLARVFAFLPRVFPPSAGIRLPSAGISSPSAGIRSPSAGISPPRAGISLKLVLQAFHTDLIHELK